MLYKKYRPNHIHELIGQGPIVKAVEDYRETHFPDTLLITGQTGVGKTSLAYIISKSINCPNGGCGDCEVCLDISEGKFSRDVHLYNASDLDTDKLRAISAEVSLKPFYDENKIIIIDELQELYSNKKAQKVLLSLTENLPPDMYILLLAMDASKIDRAIKGRCEHLALKNISVPDIVKKLLEVCNLEKLPLDSTALTLIAENSAGSLREALSCVQRVSSGDVSIESLKNNYNLASTEDRTLILRKILNGDFSVLREKIVEEDLPQFVYLLKILMLKMSGADLLPYEYGQVKNLTIAHPGVVHIAIRKFGALLVLPYLTATHIQLAIMNILVDIKSLKDTPIRK